MDLYFICQCFLVLIPSLYEAAEIDGANRWKQILHITIPSLVPMITVMLLLSVGNIMRSDTGLFYQVTRNSGQLYSTTQVIDSYVLNAILKTQTSDCCSNYILPVGSWIDYDVVCKWISSQDCTRKMHYSDEKKEVLK